MSCPKEEKRRGEREREKIRRRERRARYGGPWMGEMSSSSPEGNWRGALKSWFGDLTFDDTDGDSRNYRD